MSAKNNARTAWKEMSKMVGLDFDKEGAPVKEESAKAEPVKAAEVPTPQPPVEKAAPVVVKETPAPAKKEATVIAEGTEVQGNITTAGDMTVCGVVRGNIQCGGTLKCHGKVEGNLSAQDVILLAAKVKGDIKAKGTIRIDLDTVAIGNAEAQNIFLDGKLKGDLLISGMTQLNANAVLLGNITTDRLSICEGSRFSGSLKMTEGKDLDSMFPQNND